MTIEQFISKTRRQLDKVVNTDPPLRIATLTAHQQAARRIFQQSLDVNKTKITYKTGVGSAPRDTKYGAYSQRYANFKREKGKNTKFVDFNLNNNFRSDYMGASTFAGAKPLKIDPHKYEVQWDRSENAEKAFKFENLFYNQTIFTLSKDEVEVFKKVAESELIKIFK